MHPPQPADIDTDIDLLHCDEALIVVRKPAGLLSVPGRGPQNADCVSARVQRRHADALIVHRLDMATSGLLLMARGLDAQRALSRSFEQRRVDKRYVAVVGGLIDADSGEIDLPLICDWPNRPRQRVDHQQGKASLTRWQVLAHDSVRDTTTVQLTPVTGRSHQLRVHLQALGHPILGDELYATPAWHAASARLLLHATWIEFNHPSSGARMAFSDPAPFLADPGKKSAP